MAAFVALNFAGWAVIALVWAYRTGSVHALAIGLADVAIGLTAFCIWAWSL